MAVTGLGFGDIEQVPVDDVRQMIKQGDKLVHHGEYAEAEKVLRKAVDTYPANSLVKLKLAYVYVKQRRIREAYDLSFAVAKAEPKNSYAFAVLGATLLSAGKFEEAKVVFFNAVKLNRKEALAWAGYGMLDFYENRIFDSLDNLRTAVYHDPNEPDYLFAYAQVSARAEHYKEAADAYNRFLVVSRNTDD
ncbi:MAG TPA: tetratricopeptide repeat protein, partial [Pyrinomonadaceae bacterium]|nr:tetratricopeptide repeat protein [Pyrinomonadaceae bacterium]